MTLNIRSPPFQSIALSAVSSYQRPRCRKLSFCRQAKLLTRKDWNNLTSCIATQGPWLDGAGNENFYCTANAQIPEHFWTHHAVPTGMSQQAREVVRECGKGLDARIFVKLHLI
jgi:hypothetical protein